MEEKLLCFFILFYISTILVKAQVNEVSTTHLKKIITEHIEINNDSLTDKSIKICTGTEVAAIDIDSEEVFITGNAWVYIYDLLGNIIISKMFFLEKKDCLELHIKDHCKGVYFLQITNGSESHTRKIVIE